MRNVDAKRSTSTYIYAQEAGFSHVAKNCQVLCQTVGGVFLAFLPKIKDANPIWQIVGDTLTIRVSPRVCQNLLGKSCVLPTSKKICQVKKEFVSINLA
jgi:hypothetical protein